METRSRKRAEASSSQAPTTRSSKRSRTTAAAPAAAAASAPTAAAAPPTTRSRRSQNNPLPAAPNPPPATSAATAPMDPSSGDSSAGRRRSSGRNHSDKGKEQEPPEASRSREREREAERLVGLSFSAAAGDDDNDGDGGVSILHQNFTSASTALQGLLRKLGAGLDDLLPSGSVSVASSSSQQSGRLKKILSGLRADGEEGRQVEALTQLCEMLSIGTEESLGSFSVDSFVPVLVGLLNHESNPDIMLLAARALTHLCDVLPSSCSAVVHYGAVPCFCARLLTIEYMDLAEQVQLCLFS